MIAERDKDVRLLASGIVEIKVENLIIKRLVRIIAYQPSQIANMKLIRRAIVHEMHKMRNYWPHTLFFISVFAVVFQFTSESGFKLVKISNPVIVVITPTYKRTTRLADLTRMANTLAHVKDLHWIVVEDSNQTVTAVERILQRSQLPYTYIAHNTAEGYPAKGWFQRTKALQLLREKAAEILGSEDRVGVVYFGDDDNSYDIRLFEDYIRNVKKLGMWAVGLVGGAYVEAPRVEEGKVIFDVGWAPNRQFAVDMAGFAINIRDVLRSEAVFGTSCPRGSGAPETCLLEDMGFRRTDIEVFSYGEPGNLEILVWHTKTRLPNIGQPKNSTTPNTYGYFVEI